MKEYKVHKQFVGREPEVKQLQEICEKPGSKILVVYGKGRVGKILNF